MRFLQSLGCLTPAAVLIYGIVGVLLLAQFGGQVVNYLSSMGWTQVPGMIVFSEVADSWDTTGERYTGQVVYTYELGGTTYEGNQIDLRGATYVGNREDAEEIVAPYPVGAAVMLYVDPADPTRAVLNRDLPGAIWGIVGVGSMLFLLSIGLGARHFANRRPKPAHQGSSVHGAS